MQRLRTILSPFFSLYHFVLAYLGAWWYRMPSRNIKVIGVTGTKGKTTTVELLAAIFNAAGRKTAFVSSVHVGIGEDIQKNMTGNSMPGRFFLEAFLRRAVDAKCEYAVLEVTSQGAEMYRHRGIRFAVAVLTNLAPEHIEAHGSFEAYREAKAKFLRYTARQSAMIFLNHEDVASEYFFQEIPSAQTVFFSSEYVTAMAEGTALPGAFNTQNIAAAHSVAQFFGIEPAIIKKAVAEFRGVPGRAEVVTHEPFMVVVDYAHTPDSLEAVYQAFKHAHGKMICVLGAAGGGRDKWKRPVMGEIAGRLCDEIILTNEDPYDEVPETIIEDIASGIPPDHSDLRALHFFKILDRREALRAAIGHAKPGDVVIATGKGSESSIHLKGGAILPWNEREVIEQLLREDQKSPG